MKALNKVLILAAFFLVCTRVSAQWSTYRYCRELGAVKADWHKIILPSSMHGKIAADFSDVRIYGINEKKDTIEVPFMPQVAEPSQTETDVPFKLLNQSKGSGGYYFTFELETDIPINQIQTTFSQQNFNWTAQLEGSLDMQDWYTILDDYRIASIKNEHTDYQFTSFHFPLSKYIYYRLFVKTTEKPELLTTTVRLIQPTEGISMKIPLGSMKVHQNTKSKITYIDIDLKEPVAVGQLEVFARSKTDYFRPITISYLSDSNMVRGELLYYYSMLSSATLNSVEKNQFKFSSTVLRNLKITVLNYDNRPLDIDSVVVKGYEQALIARFEAPATYYLVYGNNHATKPEYDLVHFRDKIPVAPALMDVGEEKLVTHDQTQSTSPLLSNKMWLWSIMTVLIALLGWFSLRMIRQK